MISHITTNETPALVAPSTAVSNAVANVFNFVVARQQARADRSVKAYLARQSDIRLLDLGYTAPRSPPFVAERICSRNLPREPLTAARGSVSSSNVQSRKGHGLTSPSYVTYVPV